MKTESSNDEEPDTDPDRPVESQHGELAWEEAGLPLPAGWRVSTTRLAARPRAGTVMRRYSAPDGHHLGDLVEVMKHLADSEDMAVLEAAGAGGLGPAGGAAGLNTDTDVLRSCQEASTNNFQREHDVF